MLWKKESGAADALFVDICKNVKVILKNFRLNRVKNNSLSLRCRNDGNQKYAQNDIKGAMERYNHSICFAEKNSEHLSLAYANRSNCFLKMQMYERCLVDIEMAKKANYPERLMPKLELRVSECLKRLKLKGQAKDVESKLSFNPDDKLPCMAEVLNITKSQEYGRMVTAKRDIAIGQTILIEKAYLHSVYGNEMNRCTYCSKENMNFVPCINCADAMYCNEKCKNNNFHDVECDMYVGSDDCVDGESISFILRSVIVGIKTFETIQEMIEFVEGMIKGELHEISESVETAKSKYKTFFQLATNCQRVTGYRKIAYIVFHAIMNSSKLGKKISTETSQRFLIHLIVHHALVIRGNAFMGLCEPIDGIFGGDSLIDDDEVRPFEKEVHLISSYFNHSCLPNVIKLGEDNMAICKAMLPIKRGEQLFITYIDDEAIHMTEKQRNKQLNEIYGFQCKCDLCTKGIVGGAEVQLNDIAFKYIVSNLPRLIGNFDLDLIKEIQQKCIEFLSNYPKMIATEPAAFVLTNFGALLQKELMGP